jgi:hypothetical protein
MSSSTEHPVFVIGAAEIELVHIIADPHMSPTAPPRVQALVGGRVLHERDVKVAEDGTFVVGRPSRARSDVRADDRPLDVEAHRPFDVDFYLPDERFDVVGRKVHGSRHTAIRVPSEMSIFVAGLNAPLLISGSIQRLAIASAADVMVDLREADPDIELGVGTVDCLDVRLVHDQCMTVDEAREVRISSTEGRRSKCLVQDVDILSVRADQASVEVGGKVRVAGLRTVGDAEIVLPSCDVVEFICHEKARISIVGDVGMIRSDSARGLMIDGTVGDAYLAVHADTHLTQARFSGIVYALVLGGGAVLVADAGSSPKLSLTTDAASRVEVAGRWELAHPTIDYDTSPRWTDVLSDEMDPSPTEMARRNVMEHFERLYEETLSKILDEVRNPVRRKSQRYPLLDTGRTVPSTRSGQRISGERLDGKGFGDDLHEEVISPMPPANSPDSHDPRLGFDFGP